LNSRAPTHHRGAAQPKPFIISRNTAHRWLLPAAAGVFALGFAVAGELTAPVDQTHPRPDTVFYCLDADSNRAVWASPDAEPDEWLRQFFGVGTGRGALPASRADTLPGADFDTGGRADPDQHGNCPNRRHLGGVGKGAILAVERRGDGILATQPNIAIPGIVARVILECRLCGNVAFTESINTRPRRQAQDRFPGHGPHIEGGRP
jgi:hypothetical protein